MVLVVGGFLTGTIPLLQSLNPTSAHVKPLNMLLLVCVVFVTEVQTRMQGKHDPIPTHINHKKKKAERNQRGLWDQS